MSGSTPKRTPSVKQLCALPTLDPPCPPNLTTSRTSKPAKALLRAVQWAREELNLRSSSVSANHREPLCGTPFSQLACDRRGRSYQGESRILDSREDVYAGQPRFEYPATSVPFSKCSPGVQLNALPTGSDLYRDRARHPCFPHHIPASSPPSSPLPSGRMDNGAILLVEASQCAQQVSRTFWHQRWGSPTPQHESRSEHCLGSSRCQHVEQRCCFMDGVRDAAKQRPQGALSVCRTVTQRQPTTKPARPQVGNGPRSWTLAIAPSIRSSPHCASTSAGMSMLGAGRCCSAQALTEGDVLVLWGEHHDDVICAEP
jgi:hypothetical protein